MGAYTLVVRPDDAAAVITILPVRATKYSQPVTLTSQSARSFSVNLSSAELPTSSLILFSTQ
jgi:hypothetical protein